MSRGTRTSATYESNVGYFYPMKVQPETFTLTLGGQANLSATGTIVNGTPSANASSTRREKGVNCRQVRFRFASGATPSGYAVNGILSVPVFQASVFNSYTENQTGTYEVDGLDVAVEFVGKTGETIK